MKCPINPHSLARLPGQVHDDSARKLRREILRREATKEDQPFDEHTRLAANPSMLVPHIYAAGSLVIDDYWEYVKSSPLEPTLSAKRAKCAGRPYDLRVEGFICWCIDFLAETQNVFLDGIRSRKGTESITSPDLHFYLFLSASLANRKEEKDSTPMVSMADLPVLFGRMACVAPLVFARDIGRPPSSGELHRMLGHPSIMKFFVEIMANARGTTLPLMAGLEEHTRCDLGDHTRRFGERFFTVKEEKGSFILSLDPACARRYRNSLATVMAERLPFRALGCPALYGGKFKEMLDWIVGAFEAWDRYTG